MKILILSDLEWNKESKQVSDEDIDTFPITKDFSSEEHRLIFRSMKYRTFWRYRSIIEDAKPDVLLLAGDITGDGSCGHGFHKPLFLLLRYLESNKIMTFFIGGNHDDPKYFKYILERTKKYKYVKYIAGEVIDFKGIKILGLDFEDTFNKTRLKSFLSKNYALDIVLSHCHLHRRAWLFDFNTKYVITGHWDQNIGQVDNKIFISLVNDTPEDINYVTIELNKEHELITYYNFNSIIYKIKNHKALKKGKTFDYKPNSSKLTNTEFCDAVILMRKAKMMGIHKMSQIEKEQLEWIINPAFSKIFFTDYLGVKELEMSDGFGLKLKKH